MNRTTDLLRWPLWSWRHLSVTAAVLLLVLAGIGRLAGSPSAELDPAAQHAASPTPAASTSAPQGRRSPPQGSVQRRSSAQRAAAPIREASPTGSTRPVQAAASGSAGAAAVAFVRAWARPDLPPTAWRSGIRPLASLELAKALAATDPQRVPASTVMGPARDVRAHGHRADVTVTTNAGRVEVKLQRVEQRWLVADIEPAERPPGASTPDLKPSGGEGRGG